MIDQKRMTYIPQPPSLKCFQTAAIEPSSVVLTTALSASHRGLGPDVPRARLASEQLTSNEPLDPHAESTPDAWRIRVPQVIRTTPTENVSRTVHFGVWRSPLLSRAPKPSISRSDKLAQYSR